MFRQSVLKVTILGLAVTQFGAQAFSDDCDQIRKKIAAMPPQGGEIKVSKGIYNCSAPIIIDKSNITLTGEGTDLVTIRLKDHFHAPILIIGSTKIIKKDGNYVVDHRVENIRVSGFTFDGNRKNHDTSKECGETICEGDPGSVRNNGITIRGASKITVENVASHSMISGGLVTEKYCDHLTVRNFDSYDNFFDGFAGYETDHSEFYNMFLHDNDGAGISIDINFNNNVIRDSRLHRNGHVAIFARHLHGNHFNSLDIQNAGEHGVFLAKDLTTCAENNQFDSITVNKSAGAAFRVNDSCTGNKITGASNLCQNLKGGVSENVLGTTQVDDEVKCK